jgi:hypothetical protein
MIVLRNICFLLFGKRPLQILKRFQSRIVPMIKEQLSQEETRPRGAAR